MREPINHDALLTSLLEARDATQMSLRTAADHFVVGVSGRAPRSRSVLLDYLALTRFAPHPYKGQGQHCETCGLPLADEIDSASILQTAHAGHASNELPQHILTRWRETEALDAPKPSEADRDVLHRLVALIGEAAPDETPGQLEKRIASARVLPKTDKYKRHGILQTLAECGIMPNPVITPLLEGTRTQSDYWDAHRALRGSPRSDIVLPLAGWRGTLGVNIDRYADVFGL